MTRGCVSGRMHPMFLRKLLVTATALSFAVLFPVKVMAVSTPNFPLCVNPSGTVKTSYSSGVHGIVGDSSTHTGSDTVYEINQNQLTQCFCAEDGTGIQTNWLKVGTISESTRKMYEADGWIYVPYGSAWGLEDTGYVAKNVHYTCKESSTNSSSSSNGTSQGISVSNDSGSSVDVFSLASTGNSKTVYSFFLGGIMMLILALFLRRKSA